MPSTLPRHRGAIGPVERQQCPALLVIRGAEVLLDECAGEIGAALHRQFHGEEGDVGDGVGVAEPLVEFDAVDGDPIVGRISVGEPVDVVEAEVAVGVARNAPAGAVLDEGVRVGPLPFRSVL